MDGVIVDSKFLQQQGPSMKVFGAQRRFDAVNDESFCSCIASCYLNTASIFYEKVRWQSLCSNLPGKLTSSLFKSFFRADLIDSLDQPGNLTIGLWWAYGKKETNAANRIIIKLLWWKLAMHKYVWNDIYTSPKYVVNSSVQCCMLSFIYPSSY